MGSTDERNRKAIDASEDGLVWVRRRNGSWWPGRIIGLDEVPESSLVSPKSRTPIKLLGPDNARVDWYNLEKSKKVKAFRCGDHDACIEKAKTAAANSAKKAVKYARNRDGAIILALEIESKHLGKETLDIHLQKQNSHNEEALGTSVSSKDQKSTGDARDSEGGSDSAPELLQSGISFEEPNHMKRRRTPNDSEEDGTERTKRMRGLEDLGMGIRSKAKIPFEPVKSQSALPSDVKPNGLLSKGSTVSATKVYVSSLKRKRSQASNQNESFKRKNRRRPLTKVLESTAMVSLPITGDQLGVAYGSPNSVLSESKLPGLESHELNSSAAINNSTDSTGVSCENVISLNAIENVCEASHNKVKDGEMPSNAVQADIDSSSMLFDVPVVEEENDYAGFASVFTSCSPGRALTVRLGRSSDMGDNSEAVTEIEVLIESSSAPILAAHVNGNLCGIEKSGSEWQSKGKRNSRQMSRKQDLRKHAKTSEADNDFARGTEHTPTPSVSTSSLDGIQNFTGSSSLYDVKIEVKANYKPKNVPMVSLMSRINGKAIVGHPLTVEVLEDGFCDHMLKNKSYNPIVEEQAKKPKAQISHLPPRKSSGSKKPRKRASSSKKTRRLSSLTGPKPRERGKKLTLTKQEAPVVACIPLKLVFSRINEAMNGSSRQAPRPLPSAASM